MCIKDAPEMERLFVAIKFCLPESPRADHDGAGRLGYSGSSSSSTS